MLLKHKNCNINVISKHKTESIVDNEFTHDLGYPMIFRQVAIDNTDQSLQRQQKLISAYQFKNLHILFIYWKLCEFYEMFI